MLMTQEEILEKYPHLTHVEADKIKDLHEKRYHAFVWYHGGNEALEQCYINMYIKTAKETKYLCQRDHIAY